MKPVLITIVACALAAVPIALYVRLYQRGRRFALRDALRSADAIVALAGTRGNLEFLDAKVRTAVRLYQNGWAPRIIFSGRFSKRVNGEPNLIPLSELQDAALGGRISWEDIPVATETWDTALGAAYMRDLATRLGVPAEAILVEDQSLHTTENAWFVARIMQQIGLRRIILVTSPFHQLRAALAVTCALVSQHAELINYHAETRDWHPFVWFLSKRNRQLVTSELERIRKYQGKALP